MPCHAGASDRELQAPLAETNYRQECPVHLAEGLLANNPCRCLAASDRNDGCVMQTLTASGYKQECQVPLAEIQVG